MQKHGGGEKVMLILSQRPPSPLPFATFIQFTQSCCLSACNTGLCRAVYLKIDGCSHKQANCQWQNVHSIDRTFSTFVKGKSESDRTFKHKVITVHAMKVYRGSEL
jgi:hypothetical protein